MLVKHIHWFKSEISHTYSFVCMLYLWKYQLPNNHCLYCAGLLYNGSLHANTLDYKISNILKHHISKLFEHSGKSFFQIFKLLSCKTWLLFWLLKNIITNELSAYLKERISQIYIVLQVGRGAKGLKRTFNSFLHPKIHHAKI